MPELIRLYIRQVFVGFGLSAVFVALILYFNVANLWHLVTHTDVGPLAVLLLWVFNGIVLAGVQFGISIMGMAEDEEDAGKGGQPTPVLLAEPVPVRVPVRAAPPRG